MPSIPQNIARSAEQQSTADAAATTNRTWSGWLSDSARDAWSGIKGGARVAGEVTTGIVDHVVEHPLETAAEIGAGVVAAGAIAEAGIGAAGAAAIAAVPLAAYGAYRGFEIARTEGISAIPDHVKQSYDDAVSQISSAAGAVRAVYKGTADASEKAKVESIGEAATPFIAGGLGGTSTLLGRQILRQTCTLGGNALNFLADQMLPRAPQLVPVLVDGAPNMTTQLAALGKDVSLAGTTSMAVGINGSEMSPGAAKPSASDSTKGAETKTPTKDATPLSRVYTYKEGKFTVHEYEPPQPVSALPPDRQRFYGEENLDKSIARQRTPSQITDASEYTEFTDGSWLRRQGDGGREETEGPFKNFWIHRNGRLADGTQWADTDELGVIKVKPDGTREPNFQTPKSRSEIEAIESASRAATEAAERVAGVQTRIAEAATRRAEALERVKAGASAETLPDGSRVSVYADGTRTTKGIDTVTRELPDGGRFTFKGSELSPSWSLTERADGTLIEKGFADRGRRIMPDGTLYEYDTPDGYLTETKIDARGETQYSRRMDGWRNDGVDRRNWYYGDLCAD